MNKRGRGSTTYQRPCRFRQEDFFMFSYLAFVTPGARAFLALGS